MLSRPVGTAFKASTTSAGSSENTLKKLNGAVFTVPSKFRLVTSAMGRGTTVAVSSLYFERRGSVLKSNHIAYSGGAMMPV